MAPSDTISHFNSVTPFAIHLMAPHDHHPYIARCCSVDFASEKATKMMGNLVSYLANRYHSTE